MTPINLYLTVAPPGARGDFVAGWLGALPNFIDNQWRIDIETGRSYGTMNCIKQGIDSTASNIEELLSEKFYKLDPAAQWALSLSCHNSQQAKQKTMSPAITVLNIDVSNADHNKISWEFVVKTMLGTDRQEHAIQNTASFINVNRHLGATSNQIEAITNGINRAKKIPVHVDLSFGIVLDYNQLFVKNGSQYLADKLNLKVNKKYHLLWNRSLFFAESPVEYYQFGHLWKAQDFY
jgi:hypothetical protein